MYQQLREEIINVIEEFKRGEELYISVVGDRITMRLSDLLTLSSKSGEVRAHVPYTGCDPRKVEVYMLSGVYTLHDVINILKE